jgi:hypothetical protein
MQNDMTIRIGGAQDITGMVALQGEIYPEYIRDASFFRWQCCENVNPSMFVVAEHRGSVVGTLGIQKIMTTGGRCGGQLSWIVVARHYQGHGLFGKMAHLALRSCDGLDFIFIFANRAAIVPAERKLGMRFIGRLHQLVMSTSGLANPVDHNVEMIDARTEFPGDSPGNITSFSRTEDYKRWRYGGSTVHTYYKVSISAAEYAVVKLYAPRQLTERIGDIVDFVCDIGNAVRLQKLFTAACFALNHRGAAAVTTWATPENALRTTLDEMGFRQTDHCSYFGIKALASCPGSLPHDLAKWHLVQSDASNY